MSVAQTKTRTDPRRSNMESAEIRGGSLKTGRMKIGVIGAGAVGSACLIQHPARHRTRDCCGESRP
jgi:hypothetical protein